MPKALTKQAAARALAGRGFHVCWLEGGIEEIRNYCETDVLNTFLVYLRFELMRGRLSREQYAVENQQVRDYLGAQTKPHFKEFLAAWPEDST